MTKVKRYMYKMKAELTLMGLIFGLVLTVES